MKQIRTVSDNIRSVEGFDVRFVSVDGGDGVLSRRVEEYPYERAARGSWTVAELRAKRFDAVYPDYRIEVVDHEGRFVHGKTLLENVRAGYRDDIERHKTVEHNRARLLELAIAAIETGGEAAVRVHQLATDAGVTPPVIYYHFGSRDGLVVAAQIARFGRQALDDISPIGQAVAACTSREELREVLVGTWKLIFAGRAESRWRRISVYGSAWSRPDFELAVAAAQDEIIDRIVKMLEPCRDRGWFRPGIDLASAVAWQHSVVLARVHMERNQHIGTLEEWDRLTLESLVRAFFGD